MRVGSSWEMRAGSAALGHEQRAVLDARDRAAGVDLVEDAGPAGSPGFNSITLSASLLANSMLPSLPASGPSVLLPCQTRRSSTSGRRRSRRGWRPTGRRVVGGGSSLAVRSGCRRDVGGVLHLATRAAKPGPARSARACRGRRRRRGPTPKAARPRSRRPRGPDRRRRDGGLGDSFHVLLPHAARFHRRAPDMSADPISRHFWCANAFSMTEQS